MSIQRSLYWNISSQYEDIATKLANEGPSERDVENVACHIRCLRVKEVSNDARVSSGGLAPDSPMFSLCRKLLKYAV